MNYIFLDLEWNNTYSKAHKRFINEIIEIGAVKLDETLSFVDRIDVVVKSQITKKLGNRFKTLTNISNEEMEDGVSFSEALKVFKEWCGEDFVTVTWSNSDLYAISENFSVFLKTTPKGYFGKYLDLQKFYQSVIELDTNNQIGLKPAAEKIGVKIDDISFHRASDDSEVTARIFCKIASLGNYERFYVDTGKENFYERLLFKSYLIDDIKDPRITSDMLEFRCSVCGGKAKAISKWTCYGKQFSNIFYCDNCKKRFLGRLRLKVVFDGVKVKKTISYNTRKRTKGDKTPKEAVKVK